MAILKTPPHNNQVEISLFGPGFGECILIHYADGDWFIVDSCLCPDSKRPISLVYLEELGVEKDNVKGLLLTHWHSDHTSGAFEIIRDCPNARLYLPQALSKKEALSLAYMFDSDAFSSVGEEIKEFRKITDFLFQNKQKNRLVTVKTGHSFFMKKTNGHSLRMLALSPSDVAVNWSTTKLSQQLPKVGAQRLKNVVPDDPNLNAVAIHFSYGEMSILLGSDLEESGNHDTGWSAIVNSNLYHEQNLSKSQFFKVPHHGSCNGHHDAVWRDLLAPKPISIETPYSKLANPLPTDDDTARIIALSKSLHVTKKVERKKPPRKRDNSAEKMLKYISKERFVIDKTIGHIQIRFDNQNVRSLETTENVVNYQNAS